jgi:hypothetical protein
VISIESRQRIMKTIGEYGCYFLSLVHLSEELTGKRIDAIEAFLYARQQKWIDDDCSMIAPDSVLSRLAGKSFAVTKEDASYRAKEGEYEILQFQNGAFKHFVLGDGTGRVSYDPLGDSNTVAKGTIIGKRIFRIA